MRTVAVLILWCILTWALTGCAPSEKPVSTDDATNTLEVWHTYSADSLEEEVFETSIEAFRRQNPDMSVEVVRVPFSQTVMQFITASQGGEAPDLIRVADSHLTQIGVVTVSGVPLVEDLRPHLTPQQLRRFQPLTIEGMRMDNALLALPASQGTMSLLYNPDLFAAHQVSPPRDDWTIDDLLAAASAFEETGVDGLSIPLRWSLWVMPFLTAYGGDLFDAQGDPRFSATGFADALSLSYALEFDLGLVSSANQIDASKSKFSRGQAAMIIEGVWNLEDYRQAGINVRQALLPVHPDTGLRMRPLNTLIGWSVSSQSTNKPASVDLALWLTGADTQRDALNRTLTLPTDISVIEDAESHENPLIAGFMAQANHTFALPMRRGTQQIFLVMDTAIELLSSGKADPETALSGAETEMRAVFER
ncbi:MAG: extracellular solute-binding protein [Henriciella sp.]|nr:extracellular solute-binding protein [Henriciella sp.]